MKRLNIAILAALMAMGGFANQAMLQTAWLKGTTDKAPIFYKPGEAMVFTIEPQDINGELPVGKYFLQWVRTGDDDIEEKGKEPFTGKPFVYRTSIAKPGFVRLYAVVVNENSKPFMRQKPKFTGDPKTPEGRTRQDRVSSRDQADPPCVPSTYWAFRSPLCRLPLRDEYCTTQPLLHHVER